MHIPGGPAKAGSTMLGGYLTTNSSGRHHRPPSVQRDVNLDDFRTRFTRGDPALERGFAGFANGVVRLACLESRDNHQVPPQ
jgi:hypothetical protein